MIRPYRFKSLLIAFAVSALSFAQTNIVGAGGTVSGEISDAPPNEEMDKLVDGDSQTEYLTINASANVQFLDYDAATVTSYSMTSANEFADHDLPNFNLQEPNISYADQDNCPFKNLRI